MAGLYLAFVVGEAVGHRVAQGLPPTASQDGVVAYEILSSKDSKLEDHVRQGRAIVAGLYLALPLLSLVR